MRRHRSAHLALTVLLAAGVLSVTAPSGAASELATSGRSSHASGRVVYHPTRDVHAQQTAGAARGNRALMTNHGGKIMTTANITPIFWGTSWGSDPDHKIDGLDSWYAGYSGSHYAQTSTEYTGSNGAVGTTARTFKRQIDTSVASGGADSSLILAEVAKVITSPDPSGNGYYPVYTDVPRGSAGYCAWHSSGTVNKIPVQFAFFWKLDGDPGCDPGDTSGLHSEGLAALANVTGHELAEAMTDPASPGAWYDASGSENGDKCAWTFGGPLITLSNGSRWKVQGEWSNAAFTAGTGYPNSSGQKGCLSGL